MSKFPSQMQDKFNLRFPEGMRDAIAERAKQNGRSMNSEIIQMIEDQLNATKDQGVVRGLETLESTIEQQRELIYKQSMLTKELTTSLHGVVSALSPDNQWAKNLEMVLKMMDDDTIFQKAKKYDDEQKELKNKSISTNKHTKE
uniref:Arc family DNA-binding protein n=1 Tax=Klebsiella aerogenes TaxID=548 RepID=UPI001F3D91F5|nr:Arc family DNA-binding protein [Klebsiella aerogenes]